VRHAASAFEIRIEKLPGRINIEVEDDGGGEPVVLSPGPRDTSGRGLQIVKALADDWGVIPKPGATGKTVWATISLPDDPSTTRRRHAADPGRPRRGSRLRPGSSGSTSAFLAVGTDGDHRGGGTSLCTRHGRVNRGRGLISALHNDAGPRGSRGTR
jgi:hypothetical protein